MKRFGGRPSSPHEDALIVRMVAEGWSFTRIATAIQRPSGRSVQRRYDKIEARRDDLEHAIASAKRQRIRACNRCGAVFLSQHAGVRSCDVCRDESVSPMAPDCTPECVE